VKFFQYARPESEQNRATTKLHMKLKLIFILFQVGVVNAVCLAEGLPLNSHLEAFRPLLDKTWAGTFTNSTPDKPVIDVQKWERALNGQAVRVLHSINQGTYGGETVLIWDDQRKNIVYYYFTTGGFMTVGTFRVENGKFVSHEDVRGDADGVTEVRATSELLPNGKLHVRAEYLKNGNWTLGHECTYEVTPEAKIVFK
jgi:hypothetical protein